MKTTTTAAQRRAIYLEAAREIEQGKGRYSCIAIWKVATGKGFPEVGNDLAHEYAKLFCPIEERYIGFWLTAHLFGDGSTPSYVRDPVRDEEMRNWRVTALCFMAAMQ